MPKRVQLQPTRIEADYARALARLMAGMRRAFAPFVAAALKAAQVRTDHARTDRRPALAPELTALLRRGAARLRAATDRRRVKAVADKAAASVAAHNARELARQINVDVFADRGLKRVLDSLATTSAARMRAIPAELADSLAATTARAVAKGTRHEVLAKELEQRFALTEADAAYRAQLEVSKLNSQVNQHRLVELGVDAFIWRTSRDAKVSADCRARDGKTYRWDNPPDGDLPGNRHTKRFCRCTSEPIFDLGDDDITDRQDSTMPTISYDDAITLASTTARVAIVGAPGVGKTTLAEAADRTDETLHTDTVITGPWAEHRPRVAAWASGRTRWLIEGVTAARSLRHAELEPDVVLWLRGPRVDRGKRAAALGAYVDRWMAMYAAREPGRVRLVAR